MKKSLFQLFNLVNAILYFVVVALWLSVSDEYILCMSVSIFTVVMTAVLIVFQRDRFEDLYKSSFFKNFVNTFISAVLVFCILGVVNYLAFKRPIQHDFTGEKFNSLTEQTDKVLGQFKEEVLITIYSPRNQVENISNHLELYRRKNPNIKYEFIDPSTRPDLVAKEGIDKVPALVIEYKGKKRKVEKLNELSMTNAFIRLQRDKETILYLVTSSGAKRFTDDTHNGLGHLKETLLKGAYSLREVSLLEIQKIPEDASAVIFWGVRIDTSDREVAILEEYLKRGGTLLTSIDPMFNGDAVENYRNFLITWGVRVNNNLIVDKEKFVRGSNGLAPIVSKYESHVITDGASTGIFFPVTASVEFADSPRNKGKLTELIFSSFASWGESDFNSMIENKLQFDDGADKQGPLALAGAWQSTEGKTRVVAFGNSNFVTNQYKSYPANFLLIMSSIDWLTGADQISSFNRAEVKEQPVFISAPQLGVIFYFAVLFLPIIFIIVAIFNFRRRRVL